MIKIEELRIGNYVMYNGFVVRVYGIIPPAPRKDKRYGDGYLIEVFEGASTITARLEDISAIEISKEWLLKIQFSEFNWTQTELQLSNGKFYCSFKFFKNGRIDCFFCGEKESTKYEELSLKYIHRIQNLYSSLTFEQLQLC
jgi:hypothetical protein